LNRGRFLLTDFWVSAKGFEPILLAQRPANTFGLFEECIDVCEWPGARHLTSPTRRAAALEQLCVSVAV
jgi:hypothetical protein